MNRSRSNSRKAWPLVAVVLAALLPAARGGGGGAKGGAEARAPDIFQLAVALERDRKDAQWDRLFELVAAVQKGVEAKAGRPPYKDREALADVAAHRKLPEARPGLHSRWREARHVSKTPPGPGGT